MVTLFESFGNFATGQVSYMALISRKSRGIITLTEKGFSFKSDKDSILFQLKVSDINNFFMKKRFKLPTIELISNRDIRYTFYPHKREKSSYTTSKKMTEDLFKQLTRLTFKNERPILFEAKGLFWKGDSQQQEEKNGKGLIFLTEDFLSFKPYNQESIQQVKVQNIIRIMNHFENSSPNIQIQTNQNEIYSFATLKKRGYSRDKLKTTKLYDILHQAKEYKKAEQIRKEEKDKRRIDRIKSMFEVSNKLKLDMVRIALDMDEKKFTKEVFEWAKKFNFVIDGDYLIINYDTIPDFIDTLSGGVDILNTPNVKLNCFNCRKEIDYNAKICPFCGKLQK